MAVLHLNLKGEYFDQIATFDKKYEYRLHTEYWKKRLVDRDYDGIIIKKGYPKTGDFARILYRSWAGYKIQTITHPHFGPDPVKVFAIKVN